MSAANRRNGAYNCDPSLRLGLDEMKSSARVLQGRSPRSTSIFGCAGVNNLPMALTIINFNDAEKVSRRKAPIPSDFGRFVRTMRPGGYRTARTAPVTRAPTSVVGLRQKFRAPLRNATLRCCMRSFRYSSFADCAAIARSRFDTCFVPRLRQVTAQIAEGHLLRQRPEVQIQEACRDSAESATEQHNNGRGDTTVYQG